MVYILITFKLTKVIIPEIVRPATCSFVQITCRIEHCRIETCHKLDHLIESCCNDSERKKNHHTEKIMNNTELTDFFFQVSHFNIGKILYGGTNYYQVRLHTLLQHWTSRPGIIGLQSDDQVLTN